MDEEDARPVWIGIWGGPQEVDQAIWKVQKTRSPEDLDAFLDKLRIFMIGLGNKAGQDGSGQWLLDNFPNLLIVVSQKTYGGMFAQKSPLGNIKWIDDIIFAKAMGHWVRFTHDSDSIPNPQECRKAIRQHSCT